MESTMTKNTPAPESLPTPAAVAEAEGAADTTEVQVRDHTRARRIIDEALGDATFTFGLRPADRATVTEMLAAGSDWPEIAAKVGWEPKTLREFYEEYAPEVQGGQDCDDVLVFGRLTDPKRAMVRADSAPAFGGDCAGGMNLYPHGSAFDDGYEFDGEHLALIRENPGEPFALGDATSLIAPHPSPPECRGCSGEVARDVTHMLKTWPPFFEAVASGAKTFELRRDDRHYSVGDTLRLREWVPEEGRGAFERGGGTYTGREVVRQVSYLVRDRPDFGVAPGFVVLGLATPTPTQDALGEERVREIEARLARSTFDECWFDSGGPDETNVLIGSDNRVIAKFPYYAPHRNRENEDFVIHAPTDLRYLLDLVASLHAGVK